MEKTDSLLHSKRAKFLFMVSEIPFALAFLHFCRALWANCRFANDRWSMQLALTTRTMGPLLLASSAAALSFSRPACRLA